MSRRSATELLWERLARPFVLVDVVDALLGLSPHVVRQLAGTLLATSPEANHLLDEAPHMLRSLSIAIATSNEVCRGGLRGPIQWAETMAARGASYGPDDLFVCATPARAYDTPENRILACALKVIRNAGLDADAVENASYVDAALRQARTNGMRAQRFLDHRTLSTVERTLPAPRVVQRIRRTSRSHMYDPALAMLDRAVEPLTAEHLYPFIDNRTLSQHNVLVAIIDQLESNGVHVRAFRAVDGALESGPIRYLHPRQRGNRSDLHGILVGDILLDVPESGSGRGRARSEARLRGRSGGRPAHLVTTRSEVAKALSEVMDSLVSDNDLVTA